MGIKPNIQSDIQQQSAETETLRDYLQKCEDMLSNFEEKVRTSDEINVNLKRQLDSSTLELKNKIAEILGKQQEFDKLSQQSEQYKIQLDQLLSERQALSSRINEAKLQMQKIIETIKAKETDYDTLYMEKETCQKRLSGADLSHIEMRRLQTRVDGLMTQMKGKGVEYDQLLQRYQVLDDNFKKTNSQHAEHLRQIGVLNTKISTLENDKSQLSDSLRRCGAELTVRKSQFTEIASLTTRNRDLQLNIDELNRKLEKLNSDIQYANTNQQLAVRTAEARKKQIEIMCETIKKRGYDELLHTFAHCKYHLPRDENL